ncbi:MAG: ParA family protein [Emcibacteraceae bacterium]|nr:ParA family protein [Emcibacteraceae bacterium]MDG1857650.1 ParA family protein [Emcibacteraceae bacterium]
MRVLAVTSQKGGSGKTTLSGHLAVQAELAGAGPVVLVDTDPQGSLTAWWNEREEETPAFAQTNVSRLLSDLDQLRAQGFKLAIIDTPPAITLAIQSVIAVSDLIVIPTRPSPHDLRAAGATHRQNLAMAYALSGNETMSARLLSIDSGPDLTNENLNYYRVLAALPSEDRFDSVLSQSGNDMTDIDDRGNEVFTDDDNELTKAITVARLMEVPPAPMAEVAPEPEDDGVPALLGPEGWALQIAAYRTKDELRPGWNMLKEKYFDIIGQLEPRRSEIDFGDRAQKPNGYFYRLNAGPLTS